MDKAAFYIISGSVCWGVIGIFVRNMYAMGFNTMQITFLRALVTAVAFLLLALAKDRKLLKIELRDIWMFIGTGLISIVIFNICYFECIKYCSLSVAAILLYTSPVFVVLFSALLFKEKITKRKIAALIVAFCGCVLVSGIINGDSSVSAVGIALGLGSGLTYALYSIFGEIALKKYNTLTVIVYTFIVGLIALTPTAFFQNWEPMQTENAWLYCLGLGIISTAAPYLLYTKGLSMTEPGRAAVLANAEPVVSSIVGVVVFSEPFTVYGLLGIIAVIVAAVLLCKK